MIPFVVIAPLNATPDDPKHSSVWPADVNRATANWKSNVLPATITLPR